MTSLAKLKERLLANPDVRSEYDRLGPVYALVGAMVEARHEAGLTQEQIAERMGTTQSVVARLENAHHMPSFDLVTRYASALGRRVRLDLVPAE
ncbi:ribosome-binding protein aMBF1 (putative translation factor) [Rhizobium sp. BK602]|nr:ribosome-binding protein aMBF1 (putative translation factor) [Rhizobium sp. BK602]